MTERIFLNVFDAAWFYVERYDAPVHFGPLLVISPPVGASNTFVRDLVDRCREQKTFAAPFNYVLSTWPVPNWRVVPDDQVDLGYHVRHTALPAPGGKRELETVISQLQSQPLDRKRPLWEFHVIEGLADGRFALYLKFHHGQMDGVGAARLIGRVLSTDPDIHDLPAPWTPAAADDASGSIAKAGSSASLLDRLMTLARGITGVFVAGRALVGMNLRIRSGRAGALVGPFRAPDTILNGRIGNQRSFAVQHFDLTRLACVAKAANVTVNDVFLAVFGGALRRYLSDLRALPEQSVIGQIPVNLRETNDVGIGNSLAFIYARVHTDIADPATRLQAVHESTAAAKRMQRSLPPHAVTPFTLLQSGPQITQFVLGIAGRVRPCANLVISNVPGPRETLYFNRARVDEIYGPSVLFHGQALNATMSSYAGKADVTFTACRRTLPHLKKLAEYSSAELAALERGLGLPAPLAPSLPAGSAN